jgi:signal transduction histidine kinase
LNSNSSKQVLQDQVSSLAFLSQTQIRVLDKDGQPIADSGIPGNYRVVSVASAPTSGGTILFGLPANESFSVLANESIAIPPIAVYYQGRAETTSSAQAVPLDVVAPAQRSDTIISVNAAPMGGYGFTAAGAVASMDVVSDGDRRSAQIVSLALENSLGSLEISNGPAYGSDILRSVALAWIFAGVFSIVLAAWAGWLISKQVIHPVLALTEATRRMEHGQLSARVVLPAEKQKEFVALAHSFNSMAGQVEGTVSTLRAFVSDAAHELNTPLTALKINLELAANEPDAARKQNFLARAIEQNERLGQLTNSLLNLSRIESAQSAPVFSLLDLRQLAAEIAERFASRAEQAERNFNLNLPQNDLLIYGDASQLQRAIDNLLENALKFTSPGRTISIALEGSENAITLSVADTGIGIPPEDMPHLFERFHRGRNSTEYPGNGLGLAIVKAVVNAHSGEVHAESTLGHGTKISIELHPDKKG